MNFTSCIFDFKLNTIRNDVDLTRFLYVEWNSDQNDGGSGLEHIYFSIKSLLSHYLYNERDQRTIIFSDQWRPDFKLHSPKSYKTIVDIREYQNVDFNIGSKFGQSINIYFDYKGIFRDTFSTNEIVGIVSIRGRKGTGLTNVRKNNKNIIEVEELNENQIFKYNYNFWCGKWHTGGYLTGKEFLTENEVILNNSGTEFIFNTPNKDLKNKANNIVLQIKQNFDNKNKSFYIVRLRRGDWLDVDNHLAKSSEIYFVKKQLKNVCAEGSFIYIMSDGTDEYILQLKTELKSRFNAFSKHDFLELKQLGDKDNFALFTVEKSMLELCDMQISNKLFCFPKLKLFSLVYEYFNQSREIIVTSTGDLLVKIAEQGERHHIKFDKAHITFAYGADGNYLYKKNEEHPLITFNEDTFGQDPAPGKTKYGFIKIGNKTDLVKIGEEDSSWIDSSCYSAIYGKNTNFYCKLLNRGNIQFNNAVFGDPLPGEKKECYIIPQPHWQIA